MSDHSLPKTVDPLKYADQHKSLQGKMAVKSMSRLLDIALESEGDVHVVLDFGRDEQGLRTLKGKLETELLLTCERCLEPVHKRIESEFALGIVLSDEQAKNLPGYYEPLMVEPDSLLIHDVVEEELILSLPMFAYHDDCKLEHDNQINEAEPVPEKENPFSVLAQLKDKK